MSAGLGWSGLGWTMFNNAGQGCARHDKAKASYKDF
jgi:hypothetical protein